MYYISTLLLANICFNHNFNQAQYVNENDLGGIMFWSIDNDDFRGSCHSRPYPLIEAGKEALLGYAS